MPNEQSSNRQHQPAATFPFVVHVVVLLAYGMLTILLTWPALRHFNTAIPGDGFDGWQNYWNLWWVKQALLVEQSNPYFTSYLDAPSGVTLLFHTLNIFNGLWTLPLQLNFNLAVAYNGVVLLSYTLAGYGCFLLSLYAIGQVVPHTPYPRLVAFVGGLIFTMSPFHMAHLLGHMQVFSMIWPPFYVLWLIKTLTPWSARRTPPARQWRNGAICVLFLVLATLVDWYHTLYLLMFTGLVLLWTIAVQAKAGARSNHKGWFFRPIWVVLLIGLLFTIVLAPLLIPMVRDAGSRPDLETGLEQNIALSADLLAFVLPSEMHPLWGSWAKNIAASFSSTTSERLVFAGFVPLMLSLYIIIRRWRSPVVKFWLLIAAFFTIMALGPFLHIKGQIVTLAGWPLPLPYLLLYYAVPFINLTRSLSRYDLMIMLNLGVLSSIALAQLTMARPSKQSAVSDSFASPAALIIPVVAIILICLEFMAAPYPVSTIDTPQFYSDIGRETAAYTIAELPMNWDRPTPLLHQTTHKKRLLTAYTSRLNPMELAWRTPVFQQWRNLGPDIINQPLATIAPTIFYDFNLRYIVLDYWQMPPGPEREQTEAWLFAALPNAAPIYDDGRLKVFQTPPKTETHPYLSLGNGWGPRLIHNDGAASRTIAAQQAELYLHHPSAAQSHRLEITAAATGSDQTLTILAETTPLAEINLRPTTTTTSIVLPPSQSSLLKLTLVPSGQIQVHQLSLHP